jgi:hypothetical protein
MIIMENKAANIVEIALPQMDLQLFAEGDPVPSDSNPEPTPDPTPSPDPTPEHDVTNTQKFAHRLKEETTRAKDTVIAEMYGESHGIYTYADYQKALEDQKAQEERQRFQEETGLDPTTIQPMIEKAVAEHPTVKQASEFLKTQRVDAAVGEFSKEFPELGIKSFDDIAKLPNIDKVYEYVSNYRLSLNDAYKLANYGDVIGKTATQAQQEAIKKIAANGASSPGSLAAGGEGEGKSIFKMSQTDFRKLQEEVLRGERKQI